MSFGTYGRARTMASDYIFGVACARSGVPLLLVAPPSGGKSTVIFAIEKYLANKGENVQRISRLGLRGLQQLAEWLKVSYKAVLLNEDYATLGGSDYMVEKMGEIIGALSYSGTYQDLGLKLDLRVLKLGFVSGVQPLWIKIMMTHMVFATHVREKFLRYYMLPYEPSEDLEDLQAVQVMASRLNEHKEKPEIRIPSEFIEALSMQVGNTRAERFAPTISRELSKLLPYDVVHKALRFYAVRLAFEHDFVTRDVSEKGFDVETKWQAYHALYWVLRKGEVDRDHFLSYLGVTSPRSVERMVDKALVSGWLTSHWNDGHRVFTPTEGMTKKVGWK